MIVLTPAEEMFRRYFDEYVSDSPLRHKKKSEFVETFGGKLQGCCTLIKEPSVADQYVEKKKSLLRRYADIELEYGRLCALFDINGDSEANLHSINSLIKEACAIFIELQIISNKLKGFYKYKAEQIRKWFDNEDDE
jgi:hypothetical protein